MAKRTLNLWLRGWSVPCGTVWLSLMLFAFPEVQPAYAGDLPSVTNFVSLDYQETAAPFHNVDVSISLQSAPFLKEPAVAPGKVVRGTLKFGGAGNALPFLWQRGAQKLFLDLNTNRDLTDDPAGVFVARPDGSSVFQTFTNVHFSLLTPSGRCALLADLSFQDYGWQPGCEVGLRSFWQGRAALPGQDWQIGFIPNVSNEADTCEGAKFLFRPWDQRNQTFSADDNSLGVFPVSQKLFTGGHAYQLQWLPATNTGFRPTFRFVEQKVALGDLKITGQFVRRLLLPGDTYLVVCDHPAGTIKVPTGNYFPPNVWLEQDGRQAFSNPARWQPGNKTVVTETAPGALAVGGPLTNSVAATRHGRNLQLDYQLIGAGGQAYQLSAVGRPPAPEFAVYQGKKQLASGSFEYG